eukprot:scaffold8140_cov248-Pinguiococcus_pyrenoidosus.AAC.3
MASSSKLSQSSLFVQSLTIYEHFDTPEAQQRLFHGKIARFSPSEGARYPPDARSALWGLSSGAPESSPLVRSPLSAAPRFAPRSQQSVSTAESPWSAAASTAKRTLRRPRPRPRPAPLWCRRAR